MHTHKKSLNYSENIYRITEKANAVKDYACTFHMQYKQDLNNNIYITFNLKASKMYISVDTDNQNLHRYQHFEMGDH